MRNPVRTVLSCGVCTALMLALVGCAAKAGKPRPTPTYEETPMPTVPPATPTPVPSAAPLSTRPIGTGVKAKKGQAIGPVVTFFGAARADGGPVEPIAVDKKGIPTYRSSAGSGFILVVEAKPDLSGLDAGRRLSAYEPDDPKSRPDLEIEANRDLGNGSPAVCDRRKPNIGGGPGIKPPSFAQTQHVSETIIRSSSPAG